MRSFHRNLMFAAALTLIGAACGDGGNNPPDNASPVADFDVDAACGTTSLTCTFTDASTDSDGTIASWSWNIEGLAAPLTDQNPTHTFASNGTYTVALTVTDDEGATGITSQDIVINVAGANTPPTAQFSFDCLSLDCSFTDESSDPDLGDAVVSWEWDFGDGNTATVQNPTHSYTATAPDTFTVTLIATDNGGATNTTTNDVIVAPPASCEGATCDLTLEADATVTVTLTSVGCTADGNTLRILAPVDTTLFADGCNTPEGTSFQLGGAGQVFTNGTTIVPEVTSGSQSLAFPPTLRLQAGSVYPTWILEFDDGEGCGVADPTCGGTEPDFDDLIITITATP